MAQECRDVNTEALHGLVSELMKRGEHLTAARMLMLAVGRMRPMDDWELHMLRTAVESIEACTWRAEASIAKSALECAP